MHRPNDIDLVVAGAGGGLAGAIRAAQLGQRVLLVEASKHFTHGNNTSMSTAMIPGAGTRWQASSGIEDSPRRFVADIMHKTKKSANPEVAQSLANVSARLVTWLADYVGVPIELMTEFTYPGHSVNRCHTLPGRNGSALLQDLLNKAAQLPELDLLVPARLHEVRTDETGEMLVTLAFPDKTTEEVMCRSVLLATNGYGAVPEMVRRHIPEIADAVYHGSSESRGDAMRIGTGLGAALDFMDAYQGHAALATPQNTLAGWANVMHGGVLVNDEGQRFGNETKGYSEYAREVIAQPGMTAVLILDRQIFEACMVFEDFRQTVESGAVRWADDAASLAESFQLPPEPLSATLTEVQDYADAGATDEFGRSDWGHRLEPPFAGVRVTAALFHTQGGLRVNQHAQVLRDDYTPIDGLYASGGAAAGISGHGAAGYLAGNGLLPALGLAFLAAEHVAATNDTLFTADRSNNE
jgi:fumarate reductase flavoprotein subunit